MEQTSVAISFRKRWNASRKATAKGKKPVPPEPIIGPSPCGSPMSNTDTLVNEPLLSPNKASEQNEPFTPESSNAIPHLPTAINTESTLCDDRFTAPRPAPDPNLIKKTNDQSKDARQRQFRAIFRRWRQTINPRAISSEHCTVQPSEDYTQLIKTAILESPTRTRSTTGICNDIMKSHDNYRANRRSGWQERVAEELMQNPAFWPVIKCRKGVIIKSKDIQWQLNPQEQQSEYASDVIRYTPVSRGGGLFELDATPCSPASNAKDRDEEHASESASVNEEMDYSSSCGSVSIPTTKDSWMSGRGDETLESPDETEPGPSRSRTRLRSTSTAASKTSTGNNGIRRVQLYDRPMEADDQSQHESNGNSSSSSQSSSSQQPEATDRTGAHSPGQRTIRPFSGRGNRGSSSDDEDDKPDRKKRRFRSPSRAQNKRKFACVYHKHDPLTYGVQNRQYLVCAGTGFEYVSELIRHLHRNHNEFICGKCLRNFESDELRRTHQDGCTVRLRCSQEERWAGLWTARFPNVPVPKDPYLEGSVKASPPMINTGFDSPPVPHGRASGSSTPNSSAASSATLIDNTDISTAARLRDHLESANIPMKGKRSTVPIHVSFNMMENRVDCLEKRLPFLEETVKLLLKLAGQSMETTHANAGNNIDYASSSSGSAPIHEATPPLNGLSDFDFWNADSTCKNAKMINDEKCAGDASDSCLDWPEFPLPDLDFDTQFMEGIAV